MKTSPEQNKVTGLAAFDLLFDAPDYVAAEKVWADSYILHSAHIAAGRQGPFDLVRTLPETMCSENQLVPAEGDFVIAHGRFSGKGVPAAWLAADVMRLEGGKLAEHRDVLQDEASRAELASGLAMFGSAFPS